MNSLTISVIIPAYNNAETIKATLNSLCNQSQLADQIIVIDDCGPIAVSDILGDAYPNIEIIRHQKNMGVQNARNTGFEQAFGDLIFFLDADDLLFPNFLETAADHFQSNDMIGAYFGSFHTCDEGDVGDYNNIQTPTSQKFVEMVSEQGLPFYLKNTGAFLPSFTVIKKSVLNEISVNGKPFLPEVWGNEDFHLFIRIITRFKIIHDLQPRGIYFLQPTSISKNQKKVWLSRGVALDSLIENCRLFEISTHHVKLLKYSRQVARRIYSRILYNEGERSSAITELIHGLKRSPDLKNLGLLLLMFCKIKMPPRVIQSEKSR